MKKKNPFEEDREEKQPVDKDETQILEPPEAKTETEIKFDSLIVKETRAAPRPPRYTVPLRIGRLISEMRCEPLPEGCKIDEGSTEFVFVDPPIEDRNFSAEVKITGPDRAAVLKGLDIMIRAAAPGETKKHDGVAFFLHAVNYRWVNRNELTLKYIFRQRQIGEASAERR
jgi:hypothetical protein